MKNTKFNKRKFGLRLIAFPFVFALLFIANTAFVLKLTYHFLKYGGEFVSFRQNENATVSDLFNMLKEIREKQNELKEYNT
jgi:hypothetical protein